MGDSMHIHNPSISVSLACPCWVRLQHPQEWRSYDMLLTFNFPPPGDDSCPCLLSHVLDIPLMCVNDMTLYDIPFHLPQVCKGVGHMRAGGAQAGGHMLAMHTCMRAGGHSARASKLVTSKLIAPSNSQRHPRWDRLHSS